ncbi:MAG: N-acetyl-alpha-D-glucosaminyl L-malate synthase BshA [Fibrobacterales bacterium]
MKIGIVCYASFGGSGILATELGKALADAGHSIHFITSNMPPRLYSGFSENIYYHQVDQLEYPLFKNQPYTLSLANKINEVYKIEELDLLHVHYAIPHATSAYLAQQMIAPRKMPIVTTLHGTDITLVGKDPSFFDITRFSINQSTVVTAVSNYLRDETNRIFNTEREVETLYNFVDTELFTVKDYHKTSDDTVFLHYSNFRKVKRPVDAVKAFIKINQECPKTRLLLAGEGPLISECHRLVSEHDLCDRVNFLGNQEDIVSVIKLADVILCPSEQESFGLVAIEGMSCGIPVITSDAGGLPEVVVDGENGFLCAIGDIDAIAEKGLYIAKNPDQVKIMGQKGRKHVMENYSIAKILPQYLDIYKKAIAAHLN